MTKGWKDGGTMANQSGEIREKLAEAIGFPPSFLSWNVTSSRSAKF
jgi:hypothetical protein